MDLQAAFVCQSLLQEKLLDVFTPVALKLNNLSSLLVVDDRAVATPSLLKLSVYSLEV